MEVRQFKNILALKTPEKKFYGFHSHNLALAELDEEAWNSLGNLSTNSLALQELEAWSKEIATETTDFKPPHSTRSFSINIAQVCNLKCDYCGATGDGTYGSKKPKVDLDIVFNQLRSFLTPLISGETFEIRFLGGEPLLYPHAIKEISHYAQLLVAGKGVKIQFSIVTNGTLITPKVAQLLADLRCHITVSLDSSVEINDRVRRLKSGGSSTKLTMKGLKELQKVRDQLGTLQVNSVLGDHNINALEAYRFLKPFDFDFINLNFAASERDKEFTPIYIEEMKKVAKEAYSSGGLSELIKILQFHRPLAHIESQPELTTIVALVKVFYKPTLKVTSMSAIGL